MNGTWQARGMAARAVALLAAGILVAGCASSTATPAAGTPGASTAPSASAAPATAAASEAPTASPTPAPTGPSQAEIDAALNTPTTLTYWSWDLSAKASVDEFEKLHPAIKINLTNVGVGPAEYQKVRTALAAGTGVPDIVFMEGSTVPAFALTNSLLDLGSLGASSLQDLFLPAAWSSGVVGSQVLGLPVGSNATASYYRKDLFTQAGISAPPATWDEFAADAKILKDKTGAGIADFTPNDAGLIYAWMYEAGITPFDWTPGSTHVTVQLNSPDMKKLMAYWQGLIDAGYVGSTAGWVDAYWQAFNSNSIATWQAGVWGSPVLQGDTKTATGAWNVAPWPQWTAGGQAGSLWQGGVDDVVMKASANPIAAYEFLKFRSTSPQFAVEKYTKWGWDPVLKSVVADPAWLYTKDPYLDQNANVVWAQELSSVGPSWHWLPFMEYVTSSYVDTLGKAAADKTDLGAGLDAWQQAVVTYAQQQGFTVN